MKDVVLMCFRSSVADCEVFSFESGTKSSSSNVRLLPVFITSFIHCKKRKETKPTFSAESLVEEIFL
ncbi:hypothetical protein pdam_00024595 [Pocillopora damicornis]|uniref:Uncharacterized protein n=1 Tax=Pocillopora damicornis TaxID=46731 RepID=A0A3M6V3H9_POCDA|nr:hypothetical protein pdam_00024595 [Pocillopora damicornis]